ncbi:hypothetical protein [Streptomyces alfalfae]
MLADESTPERAASLTNALRYASQYADSLQIMLDAGRPDPEKAAELVHAIRNMVCVMEGDLDAMDDTAEVMHATADIRGLNDAALYSAITGTPPTDIRM